MKRLNAKEWYTWRAQYYAQNKNGQPQRLGQAFYNEFGESNKDGPMPDLFYQDDPVEAEQVITSNWVDFSPCKEASNGKNS